VLVRGGWGAWASGAGGGLELRAAATHKPRACLDQAAFVPLSSLRCCFARVLSVGAAGRPRGPRGEDHQPFRVLLEQAGGQAPALQLPAEADRHGRHPREARQGGAPGLWRRSRRVGRSRREEATVRLALETLHLCTERATSGALYVLWFRCLPAVAPLTPFSPPSPLARTITGAQRSRTRRSSGARTHLTPSSAGSMSAATSPSR